MSSTLVAATAQASDAAHVDRRRQCQFCLQTFTKTEHLDRHIRSHTKEKPFRCNECGKSYGRHDTLLRHRRDHAKGSRTSTRARRAPMPVVPVAAIPELDQSILSSAMIDLATVNPVNDPSIAESHSRTQPSELDAWIAGFDAQFPPWLLDDSFDIGMLETPIATTMAELAPSRLDVTRNDTSLEKPMPDTKHIWITYIHDHLPSLPASGAGTPRGHAQVEVDDNYRHTLQNRLQVRPSDQSLPSSDFLNLCVRLYFARFGPVFPVVHAPTFRPSKTNSMLLLSICSVGSLFTGSVSATSQGVQIFEQLNKAVLASWERFIGREASEVVPVIQAALIGQTFGLLSGVPRHLATAEAFHGTLIAWARSMKLFSARHDTMLIQDLDNETLRLKWEDWARTEAMIRISLGLHVHDAELADTFHHESILRHCTRQLPIAASTALFTAPTANEWAALLSTDTSFQKCLHAYRDSSGSLSEHHFDNIPSTSPFTVYAALEGIRAMIIENRSLEKLDTHLTARLEESLISFYVRHLKDLSSFEPDNLGITVLWHLTFMSLYVNFDLLESAVGRDGPILDADSAASIVAWATSYQAKRCVIHASLIQKKLEMLAVGVEAAIHVPRAMFLAGITWYCYTRYGSTGEKEDIDAQNSLRFPEMDLLKVNTALLLFEANGFKLGKPTAIEANGALSGLTDLLQRIGHWEIARKFGAILGALIHNETQPSG